jgi:type IV pilus assembly protein PilA
MFKLNSRQPGQGVTEYIIIVALLAIAAIAIYGLFGDSARSEAGVTSEEIAGPQGAAHSEPATSDTAAAGLGNFSEGAK